jgi:hypothetical protein
MNATTLPKMGMVRDRQRERENKLPKWAQDEIKHLRLTIDGLSNELDALKNGTTPSPFFFQHWGADKKFYLPEYGRIMCRTDKTYVQIYISDGELKISHAEIGTLAIIPISSNSIKIREIK